MPGVVIAVAAREDEDSEFHVGIPSGQQREDGVPRGAWTVETKPIGVRFRLMLCDG